MSIKINREKCTGCTLCTKICPGNLLRVKDKKAFIEYEKSCWGCCGCVKECPFQAIELVYKDGESEASLKTTSNSDSIKWEIENNNKNEIIRIITLKNESNRY